MPQEPTTVTTRTASSDVQMTRDEIVAFFDRRQHAYDHLDAARLAADYARECVVDSPTAGIHWGRQAAQKALQAVFDAFPDMKVRTDSLIIDGNRVAQVLTIDGTDMGEFFGLPATGKPFHLSAVLVYELEGRQIVRERRIYDFTGLLVQLGA